VKRCLARLAGLNPQLHCEGAMDCVFTKIEKREPFSNGLIKSKLLQGLKPNNRLRLLSELKL
jgi:hypothetical protein